MSELLQQLQSGLALLPGYLKFLTVVLVILPTIAATLLRCTLYGYLKSSADKVKRLVTRGNSPGRQPKIVTELEASYQEASSKVEQVNTVALIDQVYGRERFWFILSWNCEQTDYFCRGLPNLLLAFGLLGTFLGITFNLSNLSQTINQVDVSDINSLVHKLQEPLQGMGIAFITSLIAVACSSFLTVVNIIKNTSFAKTLLISSLEDYLDNVYQPTIPGHTRTDKAVDRLVTEFSSFLYRFGDTVRTAVEDSLKEKLQEIFDANIKASRLAEQVYSGLADASGTMARSAYDFQLAGEKFVQMSKTFEHSQFPQQLSKATAELASTQEKFSRTASNLSDSVESIKTELSSIQVSSQNLVEILNKRTEEVNQGIDYWGDRLTRILNNLAQVENDQSVEMLDKIEEGIKVLKSTRNEIQKLRNAIKDYENKDELTGNSLEGLVDKINNI